MQITPIPSTGTNRKRSQAGLFMLQQIAAKHDLILTIHRDMNIQGKPIWVASLDASGRKTEVYLAGTRSMPLAVGNSFNKAASNLLKTIQDYGLTLMSRENDSWKRPDYIDLSPRASAGLSD